MPWITDPLNPARHIYREDPHPGQVVTRSGSLWGRAWRSPEMGCLNEQIDDFNKGAAPGARYVAGRNGQAVLECDSRRARAQEIARRGRVDLDGGYGDMPRHRRRRKARKTRRLTGIRKATKPPTLQEIIDWVESRHEGTHYEGCWKRHPECMAAILLRRIGEARSDNPMYAGRNA